MSEPALRLDRLRVADREGTALLRGITLSLAPGGTLALVGESGSGKTLIGRAAMGMLRPPGPAVTAGGVFVGGVLLGGLGERDLARMRGAVMASVQQEPASCLDPCFGVGAQLSEAIALHRRRPDRDELAARLAAVGVPEARARLGDAPHLWSGGQLQRVVIALALANRPSLLVADEPTTALDARTQRQVLDLIDGARARDRTGVLLISHDLGLVAERADEVAVLYAGAVVEHGAAAAVLARPRHPYTAALLACRPRLAGPRLRLAAIAGRMPLPRERPAGCAFRERCPRARPACEQEPPLADGVACFFPLDGPVATAGAPPPAVARAPEPGPDAPVSAPALLALERIGKRFADGTWALRDVSLRLGPGEALGIVGESGSGKSTLGRIMLHLIEPSEGRVLIEGEALASLGREALRRKRRRMQMVFQHPRASLDPRLEIGAQILQPMAIHRIGDRAGRVARVGRLLDLVGLPRGAAGLLPYRFSGGQLQRVAIARALATDPALLIADEPVASLDPSVQAQILDLFAVIRAELRVAIVLISHDLAVVRHQCERVAVLRDGEIVETGPVDRVFGQPGHPYTRSLLEAAA